MIGKKESPQCIWVHKGEEICDAEKIQLYPTRIVTKAVLLKYKTISEKSSLQLHGRLWIQISSVNGSTCRHRDF